MSIEVLTSPVVPPQEASAQPVDATAAATVLEGVVVPRVHVSSDSTTEKGSAHWHVAAPGAGAEGAARIRNDLSEPGQQTIVADVLVDSPATATFDSLLVPAHAETIVPERQSRLRRMGAWAMRQIGRSSGAHVRGDLLPEGIDIPPADKHGVRILRPDRGANAQNSQQFSRRVSGASANRGFDTPYTDLLMPGLTADQKRDPQLPPDRGIVRGIDGRPIRPGRLAELEYDKARAALGLPPKHVTERAAQDAPFMHVPDNAPTDQRLAGVATMNEESDGVARDRHASEVEPAYIPQGIDALQQMLDTSREPVTAQALQPEHRVLAKIRSSFAAVRNLLDPTEHGEPLERSQRKTVLTVAAGLIAVSGLVGGISAVQMIGTAQRDAVDLGFAKQELVDPNVPGGVEENLRRMGFYNPGNSLPNGGQPVIPAGK